MVEKNINKPEISIIIPVYNEAGNIKRFPDELFPELEKMGRSFEVIAVEDGSKDDSWKELKDLAKKYDFFHTYRHSRNYGMGAAYQTAIDETKGDYIIMYSADLEMPAKNIKKVVEKLDNGFDAVNTNRVGRWQEEGGMRAKMRRIPSNAANWMIYKISGVKVEDTGSGLKGFKRFVIVNLKIYGDMHRFLLAYSSLYTNKITEFEVEYQERTYGKSAYGSLKRVYAVFLDMLPMKFLLTFATKPFTMMPGRIFGTLGVVSLGLGILAALYLLGLKIFTGADIGGRPLFIAGLVLIILGIQFIMTGLLGELILRIYFESSGRKTYIVSEAEE